MKNILPILLLGGGVFYFLRRTQSAARKIDIDVINIQPDLDLTARSNFKRVYLIIDILITNPGGLKTTINQLTTELQTAGEPLGTFAIQQPVVIKGADQKIKLIGSIKTLNGFNMILNALQAGEFPKITAYTEVTTNFGTFNKTDVV